MKKEKVHDIVLTLALSAIIIGFGLAILILPPKQTSEKERRPLAQFPPLSVSALSEGALGDFYSDQFPARDGFTALFALTELTLGKWECNGVVYDNGRLIIRPTYTAEQLERISRRISEIGGSENTCLYLVPQPHSRLYTLPEQIPTASAELFYKTDHHWTTQGAYEAYLQICKKLEITPYGREFFNIETATDEFLGTAYARACLPVGMVSADQIELYRYDGDNDVTVADVRTGESKNGFYRIETLRGADKYAVFLGGNYAHLRIEGNIQKPKLLLIKDSFANSVVPFLALHYDIEMIDPRYCTHAYLREQLTRNDVDRILFLISSDTIDATS